MWIQFSPAIRFLVGESTSHLLHSAQNSPQGHQKKKHIEHKERKSQKQPKEQNIKTKQPTCVAVSNPEIPKGTHLRLFPLLLSLIPHNHFLTYSLFLFSLMEDFRSKSCGDMRMQVGAYGSMQPPSGLQDFRCYSTSYASAPKTQIPKEMKFKKGKTSGGSSSFKGWSFNDPELQRKKRVASYKVYAVEGKMKGSFRKSFRWLKDSYSQMLHGWW